MDAPSSNAQVSTANATTLKSGYGGKKKGKLSMIRDYVTHGKAEGESGKHERTESKAERKREGER